MPRNRVRKTERGTKDVFLYEEAYKEIQAGRSIRGAASMFDLCHVSLMRYTHKRKLNPEREVALGYNSARKVFSIEQENEISGYLMRTADIYFGLSPTEVRRLAYDLAVRYDMKRPSTWDENKIAGQEWFLGFMKRNPELSVRCAEATSLSRATSFNRTNVNAFFNNLDKVMERYNFEPKDIYNMDETGVTTVQKPDRIVTKRGTRRVGAITSAERGVLVTVAMAANALGNALPPFFVFPRIRYQDHFFRDGPTGSVGAGNRSGWMESREFLMFLEHFKHHTRVTPDNKVLLLLDNHPSHITIEALDFCKLNGIVVLSFPPHCSHRLQPLDVSVHRPLKRLANSACDSWMRNNPGQTMTIYNIPSIVAASFPQAFTIKNIQTGFRCTGIFPFNKNIFDDSDFALSYVTDRPMPLSTNQEESSITTTPEIVEENITAQGGSQDTLPQNNQNPAQEYSPEMLNFRSIPHLRSPLRETTNTPESILALTPVKTVEEFADPLALNDMTLHTVQEHSTPIVLTSTILSACRSNLRSAPNENQLTMPHEPVASTSKAQYFSPEIVRPLSKAPPRKSTNRGGRKKGTLLFTQIPRKKKLYKEKQKQGKKQNK